MDTDHNFDFVCLEGRKRQRPMIRQVLSSAGKVEWRSIPPVSFRFWPETWVRAEQALLGGSKMPRSELVRRLKRLMLALQYNGSRALFSKRREAVAVCWNGLNGSRRAFMDGAGDAGARRLFLELAPLPGRITADPCGVNYVNSLPRVAAPYLKWAKEAGLADDGWRGAGRAIRQRPPLKAPPQNNDPLPPPSEPFIFVPLQVPGDSQLRLFGGVFKTVEAFVDALAECSRSLPEGWHLRIKQHPSSPISVADRIREHSKSAPIFLDDATDTFEQVAACHAVVTVNSSVGLESMFHDKPVIACGQCFWAIEGVAHRAPDRRQLSALFSDPDQLSFDASVRNAFMNFLTLRYYPVLKNYTHVSEIVRRAEAMKIAERLLPSKDEEFWRCNPR